MRFARFTGLSMRWRGSPGGFTALRAFYSSPCAFYSAPPRLAALRRLYTALHALRRLLQRSMRSAAFYSAPPPLHSSPCAPPPFTALRAFSSASRVLQGSPCALTQRFAGLRSAPPPLHSSPCAPPPLLAQLSARLTALSAAFSSASARLTALSMRV